MSSSSLSAIDVATLPRHTYTAGTPFSRLHSEDYGPWWFSNDGSGRFDPTHSASMGGCYVGEQDLCAWIETFRTRKTLTTSDIASKRLSRIALAAPLEIVDLTVSEALVEDLTVSQVLDEDYDFTHKLASDISNAGLGGVRWRSRHDFAANQIAVAIFRPAGAPTNPAALDLFSPHTEEVPDSLVSEAERVFGYKVLPSP